MRLLNFHVYRNEAGEGGDAGGGGAEGGASILGDPPEGSPSNTGQDSNGRVQPGQGVVRSSADGVQDPGFDPDPITDPLDAGAQEGAGGDGQGDGSGEGNDGQGSAEAGGSGEGAQEGDGKEGQKAEGAEGDDAKPKAPGDYKDLKIPDGYQTSEGALKAFTDFFTSKGLSPEHAQAVIDFDAARQQAAVTAQDEALAQQSDAWIEEIIGDPDIGGEDVLLHIHTARQAIDAFGDDKLRALLKTTGLDNNPVMMRAFWKIGKAIANDSTFVPSNTPSGENTGYDDHSDLVPELQ